jgi:hypothetical protein
MCDIFFGPECECISSDEDEDNDWFTGRLCKNGNNIPRDPIYFCCQKCLRQRNRRAEYNERFESFHNTFKEKPYVPQKIPEEFRILKMKPTSNFKKIQRAYRKMALKTHPDKGGSDMLFRRVYRAYESLESIYGNNMGSTL